MFGHTETKVIYGVPTIVKFISSNKKTTLYARSDTWDSLLLYFFNSRLDEKFY